MKKALLSTAIWMRNGIAFCTTWLLILLIINNLIFNFTSVSTIGLLKLIVFVVGVVLLFTILFNRHLIRKWSFTLRLSCFMILISIYECLGFYWMGFFTTKGSLLTWGVFVGIIVVLYFFCLLIYRQYSKKQENIYATALQAYHQKNLTPSMKG